MRRQILSKVVLVTVLVAALVGCSEEFSKGTGKCDPGVEGVGNAATMAYPGMC